MTELFSVIALAGIITYIELKFKAYALGIVSAALWVGLAFYINANPLTGIPEGSPVDTIIYVSLIGTGILIGLFSAGSLFGNGNGLSFKEKAFGGGSDTQKVISYDGNWRKKIHDTSTMEGRVMAYRASIHPKLNQRKNK